MSEFCVDHYECRFSRLIIERERKQKKKSDFGRRFRDENADEPEAAETHYDFSKVCWIEKSF